MREDDLPALALIGGDRAVTVDVEFEFLFGAVIAHGADRHSLSFRSDGLVYRAEVRNSTGNDRPARSSQFSFRLFGLSRRAATGGRAGPRWHPDPPGDGGIGRGS